MAGFEIWASSRVEITENTAWDNVNVVETGTDGPPCEGIQFTRYSAYTSTRGVGLILRCAENGLVANNTPPRPPGYAFELSDRGGPNRFAGSIDGLRIVNNIVSGCCRTRSEPARGHRQRRSERALESRWHARPAAKRGGPGRSRPSSRRPGSTPAQS